MNFVRLNELLSAFKLKMIVEGDYLWFLDDENIKMEAFTGKKIDGENKRVTKFEDILTDHSHIVIAGNDKKYDLRLAYSNENNLFKLIMLSLIDEKEKKKTVLDLTTENNIRIMTAGITNDSSLEGGFVLERNYCKKFQIFYQEFDKNDSNNDKLYHVDFFADGEREDVYPYVSNIDFNYILENNKKISNVLSVLSPEEFNIAKESEANNNSSTPLKKYK